MSSSRVCDAEVADAREQRVQDVDRRPRVVQGPVVGGRGRAEQPGQGGQLAVGRLVAGHELAGQVGGVEHLEAGPLVAGAGRGRLEEADVERRVVRHEHGVAGELEERRQDAVDARGVGDHAVGDAGEDGDERRDRLGRVDQRLELAEHLAAAHLDRADLGDVRTRPGCRRWSRGRRRRR